MANGMTTGAPVHYRTVAEPQPVGFRCQRGGRLRNDVWSWDIGTTPMGFNVVDVVGGISYSDDIGCWVTPLRHRRPSPVLCWPLVGKKTPSNTGKKWVAYGRWCGVKSQLR
ncbi:cellulose synthase subunit BcsC-related outer membrane protein [Escherichia coli]